MELIKKEKLHKHHIVPKHVFKNYPEQIPKGLKLNSEENLKLVTIEEHAEEHKKLYEKYNRKEDYIAWMLLTKRIEKYDQIHSLMMKKYWSNPDFWKDIGKKVSKKLKGIPKTEEHRLKIKKAKSLKPTILTGLSLENMRNKNSKTWKITYPNGNEFIVKNLKKYCKNNNLNYLNMLRLSTGYIKLYENYKCEQIKDKINGEFQF